MTSPRMRAWQVRTPGPIATGPLRMATVPVPEPGPGELLVAVRACGVCRTDLHVAEGDLQVHRPDVTPGHEVVGEVVELGSGVDDFSIGDRVGIAWLRHTCGVCRFCVRGQENLCPQSCYTGWDADGGFAGIHLSDVPALNYQAHLFQERQVRSVTSDTRSDARAFLDFAGRHRLEVTAPEYPLDRADTALADLGAGRVSGAAVLIV